MLYNLSISNKRKVQWASEVSLPIPRTHEKRNMEVHDFIYMIKGSWEIAVSKETYLMKPDSVLFLPAGITHQGISPCAPNTEIIYLHIYPTEEDVVADSLNTQGNSVTINNFLDTQEHPIIKTLFQRLPGLTNDPTLFLTYTNALIYEMGALSLCGAEKGTAKQIKDFLLNSPNLENKSAFFIGFLHLCFHAFNKSLNPGTMLTIYIIRCIASVFRTISTYIAMMPTLFVITFETEIIAGAFR